jgi:hypothetical protein
MSGMVAECRGPGANAPAGNGRRIEAGTYPLWTQAGSKYATWNYRTSLNVAHIPRPGVELKDTGQRSEILIHPGIGFLSSVGCLNLCTSLPDAAEPITYASSRRRVISIIEDMKSFLGAAFPASNGRQIPNAFAVLVGEP